MKKAGLEHSDMSQFSVAGNQLVVGGVELSTLVARVGQTPFYAYDRDVITRKVETLREHFPEGISFHYAIKANPMPAVIAHLAELTDGLDVASGEELRRALDTQMEPENISFAGPAKSVNELRMAIAAGITINLESEVEFDRAKSVAQELGITGKVAVRVNPDFQLKASGMKMGGGPQQFGIDAERVPALLKAIDESDLKFEGFHIFTGSQNLKAEAIIDAHDKIFDLLERIQKDYPTKVNKLNIGGGLGIPYFPGEKPLDLAPIGHNLERLLQHYQRYLEGTEVIVELGRYLVGESGVYVCEITDIKESRGETFLITNGGLHHHLAASGNFGQVLRKNYPAAIGNRMAATELERASVVGPLCTPLDLLANKMELPSATIGDYVVIFQSGAYGITASPEKFLSHPHAVEVLV